MCDPISLTVGVGMAAASAGLSIAGQEQQHQGQVDYANAVGRENRAQMDLNREAAVTSMLDQIGGLHDQLSQERQASGQQNFLQSIQAAQARGQVLAAAGESGLGGNGLDDLVRDFVRQKRFLESASQQNLSFKESTVKRQTKAIYEEAGNQINRVRPIIQSPIQPVDYSGAVLGGIGQGLSIGTSLYSAGAQSAALKAGAGTGTQHNAWFS